MGTKNQVRSSVPSSEFRAPRSEGRSDESAGRTILFEYVLSARLASRARRVNGTSSAPILHWVDGPPVPVRAEPIEAALYQRIRDVLPVFCVDTMIVRSGRLLLLRRKREPQRGRLWIQGGRLRFGESPEDGARRRAREECGLEVRLSAVLGTFSTVFHDFDRGGPAHTVNLTFLAEPLGDWALVRPDSDHGECVWWDLSRPLESPYLGQLVEIARGRGLL